MGANSFWTWPASPRRTCSPSSSSTATTRSPAASRSAYPTSSARSPRRSARDRDRPHDEEITEHVRELARPAAARGPLRGSGLAGPVAVRRPAGGALALRAGRRRLRVAVTHANFTARILDGQPAESVAIIERSRQGERREWTFPAVRSRVEDVAAALHGLGVRRGDVVMTLVGNRPEWVFAMLAAFRQGYVVLPCSEQLRAKDLRQRLDDRAVAAVIADPRNRAALERPDRHARSCGPTQLEPATAAPPPIVTPAADEPALMTFTSGTSGQPKCVVHAHRYLWGQRCKRSTGWTSVLAIVCGARPLRAGRSRPATASSRPGCAARRPCCRRPLRRRRADADRRGGAHRCALHGADRVPRDRQPGALRPPRDLRTCLAAGEALNSEILRVWRDATGVAIRDGYGQTETGQLTAMPVGAPVRPGSMGTPLPGVRAWVDDGELVVDASTVPTFFLRYHGEPQPDASVWRTGDRVTQDEDGYLYFEGRADDVIVSAGYRIGPFEVESALLEHPAVADVGSCRLPTTSAAASCAPSSSSRTASTRGPSSRASSSTTSRRSPPRTSIRGASTSSTRSREPAAASCAGGRSDEQQRHSRERHRPACCLARSPGRAHRHPARGGQPAGQPARLQARHAARRAATSSRPSRWTRSSRSSATSTPKGIRALTGLFDDYALTPEEIARHEREYARQIARLPTKGSTPTSRSRSPTSASSSITS